MSELESKIQAPTATPEQFEQVVSSLSSSTVEGPRQLSESLSQKLRLIAERHEGVVPIHGRLFAQWLHFAFPSECPYPQQYSAELLKPGKVVTDNILASPEEKTMHIEVGNATEFAVPSMSQWSDEEILIFVEPEARWFKTSASMAVRIVALCALLWAAWLKMQSAICAVSGRSESKEDAKWTV